MRLILILFVISITTFAQPVTVEIEALPEEPTSTLEVNQPSILMIDNFEDGDLVKFREWWSFGKVVITPVQNEKSDTHYIEKTSLEVNASSNNWYAGGFGTYLNENASYFSVLKLVIYAPKLKQFWPCEHVVFEWRSGAAGANA